MLDGEIVPFDLMTGTMLDFNSLQRMPRKGLSVTTVKQAGPDTHAFKTPEVRFIAFDCLSFAGQDLRSKPIEERKDVLQMFDQSFFSAGEIIQVIQLSQKDPRFIDKLTNLIVESKKKGFEGVVVKPTGPYSEYLTKSRTQWIKIKALGGGVPPDTLDLVVMGVYKGTVAAVYE